MRPLAWILILINFGCTFQRSKDAAGGSIATSLQDLNFEVLQEKVFAPHCVGCHLQYTDYKLVKNDLAAIQTMVNTDRMPKFAPLSLALKALLNDWIVAGAPQVAEPEEASPDLGEGLRPTWDSISLNIFFSKCTVCHGPQGEAPWIDLTSRSKMLQTLSPHLNLAKPEESYLVERLRDPEEPMPPLPPFSNLPQLTENEIRVVIDWIAAGIP